MFDLSLFSVAPGVFVLACLLDLLLGDPEWVPHPVRWIGWPIGYIDRHRSNLPFSDRISGLLVGILYPLTVGSIVVFALVLSQAYSKLLFAGGSIFFLWSALSVRSLFDAGKSVLEPIRRGKVKEARNAVDRMVGRKTEFMNEEQISRAAVESIAEGFLDGVASPLFWVLVAGVPGVMVYKTVNTLDSMIGYRSEEYLVFGTVSARLDDCLNWVPARLILLVIPLASLVGGNSFRKSLTVGFADRTAHPSPNAGHPEAAFAGALGCRLGGKTEYDGYNEWKPFLNEDAQSAGTSDLEQCLHLYAIGVGMTEIISLSFLLLL
ncbi:MAG: adenosylcobinamide-phosphate synthase CbiB [bacterium]